MQGGCVGKSKDKGVELYEFDGGVVGGVGWCDTIITRCCKELDMFSEVELTLLNLCLAENNKKKAFELGLSDRKGNLPFCGASM